jgi:hypothetical protein
VGGLTKFVVKGSFGGRPIANIFHTNGSPAGGWSVPDLTAAATALQTSYKNHFMPQLANGYALQETDAFDLGSTLGNAVTVPGSGSGGDISSGNLPNNVAACLTWHIARHYRGGHPRTYFGGFKMDVLASTTTFTGTFTAAMTAAAAAFISDIAAIGPPGSPVLACVHYVTATSPWRTPVVDTITAGSMNPRVDSQRRRLGK